MRKLKSDMNLASISEDFIRTENTYILSNKYSIYVSMGSHHEWVQLDLDMTTTITFVSDYQYDQDKSSEFSMNSTQEYYYRFDGNYV